MAYMHVLTVLSGAADDRETLRAAAGLLDKGGILRVVLSLPMAAQTVWAEAAGGAVFAAETVNAIHRANLVTTRQAAKLTSQVASEFGLSMEASSQTARIEFLDPFESTAWLAVPREAPLAELVVMGPSLAEAEGFWAGPAAEALMHARLPILIVRGASPTVGGVVAIAWDGSLPAGRAVRAAMPLLAAAKRVVIIQDPEGLSAAERDAGSPVELKQELERRGITDVTVVMSTAAHEGAALSKAIRSMGASVVISGAFGHSRLREVIFGGATQSLMALRNVHHFMAH